jgi:hypothetical protein
MAALILIFGGLIVGSPVLMLLATLIICFRDMSKSSPVRASEHPIFSGSGVAETLHLEESITL